jgi:S-adenosyl-L-methionine hydrolase (adenosine-forming)
MIVLFTDFGSTDPYVGQMKAVLACQVPDQLVIDLLHAVPDFNAHAGAILLDAMSLQFPVGTVFVGVVDPGVGGARRGLVVLADGRWYVGPDNGLLSIVAARARQVHYWHIDWLPDQLSNSFHGRDVFAPIAAEIARQGVPGEKLIPAARPDVCFDMADLPRVVYLDHYGNAWTGMRAGSLEPSTRLIVRGHELTKRNVFHEAAKGEAFWYVNSAGLVEIAVNRGSATESLGLKVGDLIRLSGLTGRLTH